MNYDVLLVGNHFPNFDRVVKLFMQSAYESDYKVRTYSYIPENICSSLRLRIFLKGSLKNSAEQFLIDFDQKVLEIPSDMTWLSPKSLGISVQSDGSHYWNLLGHLVTQVQDLTPAYITGYLLEQQMDVEAALFRQYLS